MKNNTFQEISAVLAGAHDVLLYPHIHMDGDALGSCAALCKALRAAGAEDGDTVRILDIEFEFVE